MIKKNLPQEQEIDLQKKKLAKIQRNPTNEVGY